MSAIAIIGMACRYPDARSPGELWENVLAQRRSFRRIPATRLPLADYSQNGADGIYVTTAALLEDYEFDRLRFQVSKETFSSTDLVHWLALDVASQALEDARLMRLTHSQRERVGVYIGNSLTGEFSRANLLRLRWPYVRRVLAEVLQNKPGNSNGQFHKLLAEIEALYKAPFPPTTEESLAGGLSNTIPGRICNYFNFKGGGYTVDAACASSLLAVTTACSALESGDIDIAIAGGVDLSLDPFELAGFSKLGALAKEKMRVFDAHSAGFWPGEGCGMAVLMRCEEALARHHSPYAVLRGWGVSSDGSGGITRPEVSGQLLALQRAYRRAQYGIDSVAYFEGHGTGTSVGDAVELQALSGVRREARADAAPAALGSIKANIGHTKAAAGIAGLIKATIAVQAGILPPTTGCDTPHPELTAQRPMLRVLKTGELWPEDAPARAGVSAMGFGGINTHVTLEAAHTVRRRSFSGFEQQQLSSPQDCELFLFQAADRNELAAHLRQCGDFIGDISMAEMADLAACLANEYVAKSAQTSARAACVASTPDELTGKIKKLIDLCKGREDAEIDSVQGIFLGDSCCPSRIGFLFTGQGTPVRTDGGIWSKRFASIRQLYRRADLPKNASIATETAQPCIATASLAGLEILKRCGIEAEMALGHSLGEITALYWAGACEQDALLRIVRERGRLMAQLATVPGAMASISLGYEEVERRLNGDLLNIASYNSPTQTVVSGETASVKRFAARLGSEGIRVTTLPVSHAFHSPLMAAMATEFSSYLRCERFQHLRRPVISTVTTSMLHEDADLRELLTRQITQPVQFAQALAIAAADVDLFIEIGPGEILSGIACECVNKPVIALNAAGESLRGLLLAVGAAFVSGAPVRPTALFEDRFVRPFDLKRRHTFLQNPCETNFDPISVGNSLPGIETSAEPISPTTTQTPLNVLRMLVAQRADLPLASIKPESRFLDDLHLNSIAVSQMILQMAAQLNLPPPAAPSEYANASIAEAAQALATLGQQQKIQPSEKFPSGVDSWIRVLAVELTECERPRVSSAAEGGTWQVMALADHPLRAALEKAVRPLPGTGAVICVPAERDFNSAEFLLTSVRRALKQKLQRVVFAGSGAAALARTLCLENFALKVSVVEVPQDHPKAAEWIVQEAAAASRMTEAHYDAAGVRREPRLKLLWPDENTLNIGLGPEDVLLVAGGGKGIAAECALAIARESKCCLALLGRSNPESDQKLKENLLRFQESGVSFRYFAGDVRNADDVRIIVSQIETQLGSVTAILHAAGTNVPKRLEEITAVDLNGALAPKVTGLRNVLDSINPAKLRLLVTFGSIIARTGLHGEGHYGLANEWMAEVGKDWQRQHPDCRCLNLEWSVWAGTGMGQRLGVLDSLMRQGIAPLPLDDAINTLKTMLAWKQPPLSCIVTGRFGRLPTLQFPERELPLRRFLEQIEIHYPGIELVTDATLSVDTDPYLAEHVFQGERLLPAVCGIEAMAQVAMALEETDQLPEFRSLRFEHPIVVPPQKSIKTRIAALRREPGRIDVAIRCANTSFQVDHFRAECLFDSAKRNKEIPVPPQVNSLAFDPGQDLYGPVLFHQGRFRRVDKYHWLQANESIAQLNPPSKSTWFARHLSPELVAGDPASRDAALHSVQACIPHKTILPVGIDSIRVSASWTRDRATVHAIERLHDDNNFIYDLTMKDADGRDCEHWQGLHLRAVAPIPALQSWPTGLIAPYLERKLAELLPWSEWKIALTRDPDYVHAALTHIIGPGAKLKHRPDGQPEIAGYSNFRVSLSHSGDLTLMALANDPVGCDMEPVIGREPAMWNGLLGQEHFSLAELLVEKSKLSPAVAATHIWTLKESLRKSGANLDRCPDLESARADGWLLFSDAQFAAATWHVRIQGADSEFCFGFVVRKKP
ncbi:MAG TPA: SDR family NAD(P)-dependent oxidoreductase [Candidatus Angelobacter sp.]